MESILVAEVQLWLEVLRAHESLVNLREAAGSTREELDSCFLRLEMSLDAYRRWLTFNRDDFARLSKSVS